LRLCLIRSSPTICAFRFVVLRRPSGLGVDHDPLDKGRREGVGWWGVGLAGSTSLQRKKLQYRRTCGCRLWQACSLGMHKCTRTAPRQEGLLAGRESAAIPARNTSARCNRLVLFAGHVFGCWCRGCTQPVWGAAICNCDHAGMQPLHWTQCLVPFTLPRCSMCCCQLIMAAAADCCVRLMHVIL
jgi:hypothetical protein